MTIRLRPHHLLCMLTYVGKGYSAAFVDNYDRIAARLSAGEDMLIVEGPDDICGPVADTDGSHCRTESVSARDAQAAADAGALLGQTIRPGLALSLTGTQIEALRSAFRTGPHPACLRRMRMERALHADCRRRLSGRPDQRPGFRVIERGGHGANPSRPADAAT